MRLPAVHKTKAETKQTHDEGVVTGDFRVRAATAATAADPPYRTRTDSAAMKSSIVT